MSVSSQEEWATHHSLLVLLHLIAIGCLFFSHSVLKRKRMQPITEDDGKRCEICKLMLFLFTFSKTSLNGLSLEGHFVAMLKTQ